MVSVHDNVLQLKNTIIHVAYTLYVNAYEYVF